MPSYEHKKLIETLIQLDQAPEDPNAFSQWIQAESHLAFLRGNARADELIICAGGGYSFLTSVVVSNDRLQPIDQDDLLEWNFNHYTSSASYVAGGGRDDVWVERGLSGTGTKTLEDATLLIFGRTFEGWTGPGRTYYEVHQEYAHLTEIHWRPEQRAYCRFNNQGDLEPIVSVTSRDDKGSTLTLVSFKWTQLEEYLLAANASLVRLFDFTLWRPSTFSGWQNEQPQKFYESESFFYRRLIMDNHAAYTRGVQIIRPRERKDVIFKRIMGGWFGHADREYATFLAHDWRNDQVRKISTDPKATTNYFDMDDTLLPFELSPVFFRPEVLLKYKGDRDKYTLAERSVTCRSAWHLEGIDVNEAGQVHAYICDLRRLPYEEQLHWLSFNEPPKGGISERAFTHDFKGEWATFMDPLQSILSIVRRWHKANVEWWTLRETKLLEHVNTPISASRDEWAEAFMALDKLVVEGFETKRLRTILDAIPVSYTKEEQSLALLEKLVNKGSNADQAQRLTGLRSVHHLRSKTKGHAGGGEGEQLAQDALTEHETYRNHFRHICTQVADELEKIEQSLS